MIVDDSLTVRTILKRMVESDPALHVTATASSAETALLQLKAQNPDVVLLDLEMPGMGGLEALPAILALAPQVQVLVVSALTEEGAEATVSALAMGAADTMLKPRPGEFTEDYRASLIARIRALGARGTGGDPRAVPAALSGRAATSAPVRAHAPANPFPQLRPEVIAIGASTGGIHALGQLLGQIGPAFTQPILITQHLPASFMPVFARQIANACGRPAMVAHEGLVIAPGSIVIASGEGHLVVRRRDEALVAEISAAPASSGCRPSVDPMLASLAETCGPRTLAIILSGMGSDGLAGAATLAAAGGTIFAQDAASSAVWGMPGVVTRAGLASLVAPPEALGQALMACAIPARAMT
ncbi:MAG: chemotaxis-specific protein-glutamate methyltransferase CheB [Erythrobacter sp.]